MIGDVRVHLIKYGAGDMTDHWYDLGQVTHVLNGGSDSVLRDRRTLKLRPGMSYHISDDGDAAHRSSTQMGAKLFILDENRRVESAPTFVDCRKNLRGVVTVHPDLAAFDRLRTRIQGLRSKTTDNGCTEAEALLAAAKVAELLDRYDLSLTDVEIRNGQCEQRHYETRRKKRISLDACIDDIASFCDCRVWREKSPSSSARYVFFGLRADIEVAHYLTELIDNAVRSELGRYKNSGSYRFFRHQDRHMANSSFTLGMIA